MALSACEFSQSLDFEESERIFAGEAMLDDALLGVFLVLLFLALTNHLVKLALRQFRITAEGTDNWIDDLHLNSLFEKEMRDRQGYFFGSIGVDALLPMLWLGQVLVEQLHLNIWPVDDIFEMILNGTHIFFFISEVFFSDKYLFIGVLLQPL